MLICIGIIEFAKHVLGKHIEMKQKYTERVFWGILHTDCVGNRI